MDTDLMYLTTPVPTDPRPAVRRADKIVDERGTVRRVSKIVDDDRQWQLECGNSFWDLRYDYRLIDDSTAGRYYLARTQEYLDGQHVRVPAFGKVEVPHAGLSVRSVRDVMGLEVFNGRGARSKVVAQSSVLSNPWVVLEGGSSIERTVPIMMLINNWRTKKGQYLIEAYLGTRQPKAEAGLLLGSRPDEYAIVEAISDHFVLAYRIKDKKSLRINAAQSTTWSASGSKLTLADVMVGWSASRKEIRSTQQLQLAGAPEAIESGQSLGQRVSEAIETALPQASTFEAQLRSLQTTAAYLLDHLDLLPELARVEAQSLLVEHLGTALDLHTQALEHSITESARHSADERLSKQLGLIESAVDGYRSRIEGEVARKQEEHSRFLDDKLGRSSLD